MVIVAEYRHKIQNLKKKKKSHQPEDFQVVKDRIKWE